MELQPLRDAARAHNLSQRTLQRWIRSGQLTAYRKAGDRLTYVDLVELRRVTEPRPRD